MFSSPLYRCGDRVIYPIHVAKQQDLISPPSKVCFHPTGLALKVGNNSGIMPEKTVQQLLSTLASVFSVKENHPQAANSAEGA